jgi:hypothetical protein
MTEGILQQALAYASRGWPVFPCQPGQKIPATRHGYRDATTDQERITAWFSLLPSWNLAIATGTPGPDVLDVDQHGPAGTDSQPSSDSGGPDCWTARVRAYARRAVAFTSTSRAQTSTMGTWPVSTWTSGPQAATSSPRHPVSAADPTGSSRRSTATAAWTGPRSPGCCNHGGSRTDRNPARPWTVTSAAWRAGSNGRPKEPKCRTVLGRQPRARD